MDAFIRIIKKWIERIYSPKNKIKRGGKRLKSLNELNKKINLLKAHLLNIENYIDLVVCDCCELLTPLENVHYVGNERICEECLKNGYGK